MALRSHSSPCERTMEGIRRSGTCAMEIRGSGLAADTESWILAGPLVHFDPGLEAGQLNETPIGTNMAFGNLSSSATAGFEPALARIPATRLEMKIASLHAAFCRPGSHCISSRRRSSITPFPRIA